MDDIFEYLESPTVLVLNSTQVDAPERIARALQDSLRGINYVAVICTDLRAGADLCMSRPTIPLGGEHYEYVGVSKVMVSPDARGRGNLRRLLALAMLAADLLARRLAVTEVHSERLYAILDGLPHLWQPLPPPNPGVAPEAFVLGPRGPALQLTPTKALLCRVDIDLMKSVLGGSANAAEMYVRLQSQPFERRAINPLVHRIVEFDPPLAALGDVWKRTGTGFGGESDLTPFLRVAGTDRWLRADAHVHTAL